MAGCFSQPSKLASLRNGTFVLLLLVSSYSHLEAGFSVGPTFTFYIASCLPLGLVHPHTASSQYHSCSLLFSCFTSLWSQTLSLVSCEVYGKGIVNFKILPQHLLGCKLKIILVRNAIDAHAQVIVENDEMLLSVLKVLTHFTLTVHATINS